MSILERLGRDMIIAVKARDAERVGVIRLIRAEVQNREIEVRRALTDDDAIEIVSRQAKKLREAIGEAEQGKRGDLAEKGRRELAIVEGYLPAALSEQELLEVVDKMIGETGASTARDVGAVMRALMPTVKGRVDGKRVKDLVESRLRGMEAGRP